ncbi:aminopeptidase N [Ornithinimicrobium cryptoxanthini]|uniref:Aminopeptidase N n=1 Tax=Ornithinimicrobium cryptoxanthini TaxID=2934161 RepID=A0ABY4YE35_9MICO|nr:aminopeptidase N [Ornithinimicrobium cryptoxanthini]USQ74993.1 aminopeptidase N [Ornithinimicrobium cryptoxanthini]
MTAEMNLTHAECAERARTISLRSQRVELDLSGAPDPAQRTFRAVSTVTFGATTDETWIDIVADSVIAATLNGTPLDVSTYDGARLVIAGLEAENELRVEADCVYSVTGEGLHRFTDPEDDNTYLYTHFEPTDSRRLYPVFEQPDLKAEFTFVVTAPQDWEILSGQPEVGRTTADGCATVTFAPTPPLSSYITAVAAGPYHRVESTWSVERADGSRQEIPLTVLCRRTMVPHFDADDVLTVTHQGLDFFDRHFGFPYPWGKYDQIFVPEYNIGAMENPGLVTFTEQYLHRGTSTRAQRQGRASTVMHEMAHMWFGDLVTMRWWDGLWLKESFADLMGYHVTSAATQYADGWVRFAADRKQFAYRQDQLPSTHPIVAVIDDVEAAQQNFDGITYAKGAAALKQLMAYVGQEPFFAGSRDYFARHAFGNTEVGDLMECLERASGRDLETWSQAWLETAGISELTPVPEVGADGHLTRLVIEQDARDPLRDDAPVERPHRLVLGLYRLKDEVLTRTRTIELDVTGARTEVPQAVGEAVDLILVNDDDLTYAKVRFDKVSLRHALEHTTTISEPLSRAIVWSSLWNATRDAVLPVGDYVRGALAQLSSETHPALAATVLTTLTTAIEDYTPVADRDAARSDLVRTATTSLAAAESGSDLQIVWARALVRATASCRDGVAAVRGLLDGTAVPEGLRVDQELRWAALAALTAQDDTTEEELAAELAQDATMGGRTAHVRASSGRPGADAKARVWEAMTTDTSLTNDRLRAMVAGFTEPASSHDRQGYAEAYLDSLTSWWSGRTIVMATVLARGLFPRGDLASGQGPEEHEVLVRVEQWLRDHESAPAALRRIVIEEADGLLRALRAQAAA